MNLEGNQENEENCGITIIFTKEGQRPLHISSRDGLLHQAEGLCILAAIHCKIPPLATSLFGLYRKVKNEGYWLCPSETITIEQNVWLELYFLIRFQIPVLNQLYELSPKVFEYYFHQVRNDFISGVIPDANKKEDALGLAVTDMLRVKHEMQITFDMIERDYRNYLPHILGGNYTMGGFFEPLIRKTVHDNLIKLKNIKDVKYIKERYMMRIHDLAPLYGSEEYIVLPEGEAEKVTLQIAPFVKENPGLRQMYQLNKKEKDKKSWKTLCAIEEICFISIRSDKTLQLTLLNEKTLTFSMKDDPLKFQSFVSALDGYYRLMEVWTYNLCKALPSPSLQKLKSMRCHGPVGEKFAYEKLRSKQDGRTNLYLLRQGHMHNYYCLDICLAESEDPQTLEIVFMEDDGKYCFWYYGDKLSFSSTHLSDLIQYYQEKKNISIECVSPSDYDKCDKLLLCKRENWYGYIPDKQRHLPVQCINPADISIKKLEELNDSMADINSLNYDDVFESELCTIQTGIWKRNINDKVPVALKMLKNENWEKYTKEFMRMANNCLFWQDKFLVTIFGLRLTIPVAIVMEHLPLGPLDKYLKAPATEIKDIELLDISLCLSDVLWFLEERDQVHGRICCHNVYVAQHDNGNFKVKLMDPGVEDYRNDHIHWIPPECYETRTCMVPTHASDTWAFGTTLWEIYSFGSRPGTDMPNNEDELIQYYRSGKRLTSPVKCPMDMYNIMMECWSKDPNQRPGPIRIIRDIHQLWFEAYNPMRNAVSPSPSASSGPFNFLLQHAFEDVDTSSQKSLVNDSDNSEEHIENSAFFLKIN